MSIPTSSLSGPSNVGVFNNSSGFTTGSGSSGVNLYQQRELENIRKRHNTSSSPDNTLPPDGNISQTRDKSELYADASTTTFRPQRTSPTTSSDSVYTHIMQSVPGPILPLTQQILLLNWELRDSKRQDGLLTACEILGLDLPSLLAALSGLHSILIIPESRFHALRFHHDSFMEFLLDVNRFREEFCIQRPEVYGSLLKRALMFIKGFESWEIPSGAFDTARQEDYIFVSNRVQDWIQLARMDEEIITLFVGIDFSKHSSYLHTTYKLLEARVEEYEGSEGRPESLQSPLAAKTAEVAEEC